MKSLGGLQRCLSQAIRQTHREARVEKVGEPLVLAQVTKRAKLKPNEVAINKERVVIDG